MPSYVCGQCHVEYYCASGDTLEFEWRGGLEMEQIEAHWNNKQSPDCTALYDYKHGETA